MYGRISRARDSRKNWMGKSREFKKFWNWRMIALCSSCDLRAKLRDDATSTARSEPSLRTTTPFRISVMGTNDCVGCALTEAIPFIVTHNEQPTTNNGNPAVFLAGVV